MPSNQVTAQPSPFNKCLDFSLGQVVQWYRRIQEGYNSLVGIHMVAYENEDVVFTTQTLIQLSVRL